MTEEKDITWAELCGFAKKYGADFDGCCINFRIYNGNFYLFKSGSICDCEGQDISTPRTYVQMKAIIENLFDEVK
jgi:hypothetical protein